MHRTYSASEGKDGLTCYQTIALVLSKNATATKALTVCYSKLRASLPAGKGATQQGSRNIILATLCRFTISKQCLLCLYYLLLHLCCR